MNYARTCVCLAGIVLVVADTLAQDDLPEWPKLEVEFEVLDESLEVKDLSARPGRIWPRFAVSYAVDSISQFYQTSSIHSALKSQEVLTERLLNTSAAKSFSERQGEFVQSSVWLVARRRLRDKLRHLPDGGQQCTLYAVTEQDARLMAEASLEILDAERRAKFEETKGWLLKYSARLAESGGELSAAERGMAEARVELERARQAAPHKNRGAAEEDIGRLEVSLWSIEVSVAGVNAKIAAIQRLKTKEANARDSETSQMLDRLLMEQDVELAGLLAQRDIVGSRLNLAKTYVAAANKYNQAILRWEELKETIKSTRKNLEQSEKRLRTPDSSRRPVRLFGKVVIQPIKYPGE